MYTMHGNLKITLHTNHKATITQLTIQTPLSSTEIQILNRMRWEKFRIALISN